LIVGPFKVGKEAARLDEIKLQPVLERRLEAVRRDERLGERLFERFRSRAPPGRGAPHLLGRKREGHDYVVARGQSDGIPDPWLFLS
jgi:hypothetical protein